MPPQSSQVANSVRSLILEMFAQGMTRSLGDNDVLTDVGALDSLRMVEFVLALEQRFHVRVDAADITPANFGTISAIAAYITRKQ